MMHNTGISTDAAETAALAIDGSQPVWMTLNEARERAFTGEIVFETDPEVLAYLDHGIVYYAERVTDASLSRRLLDAGVLDDEQLDRGTVRVGDIEHLGRLFDRDPSVDRDAVVVVAETATEELITDLANRTVTTVRVTAYRHHPSGVHRWFVAPLDPAAPQHPVSAVAQLDSTVVDQLPGLPFVGTDELTIEWDDQIDVVDAIAFDDEFDVSLFDVAEESIDDLDVSDDIDAEVVELSLELAEFTDDIDDGDDGDTLVDAPALEMLVDVDTLARPDEGLTDEAITDEAIADEAITDEAMTGEADDFEFAVVWPDGSEEPAAHADAHVDDLDVSIDEPVVTQTDDGNLEFTMPALELSDEPELADADVPDDVSDAVRRAIAAIESASVAPPAALAPDVTTQVPEIADVEIDDAVDILSPMVEAPMAEPLAAPVVEFGGFAPPTMAMRAEVLYGLTDDDAVGGDTVSTFDGAVPTGGVASVVFVDEPVEEHSGGGNERSSALRRLIGSLRRKDH